jgi:hypothetical protein
MKAFRICVDGRLIGDFGVEDQSHIHCAITLAERFEPPGLLPHDETIHFSLGGGSAPRADGRFENFRWDAPKLSVGSRVEIEIVEVASATPPTKRAPYDRPHDLWTMDKDELRRQRYERYLELKEEFEPGS